MKIYIAEKYRVILIIEVRMFKTNKTFRVCKSVCNVNDMTRDKYDLRLL